MVSVPVASFLGLILEMTEVCTGPVPGGTCALQDGIVDLRPLGHASLGQFRVAWVTVGTCARRYIASTEAATLLDLILYVVWVSFSCYLSYQGYPILCLTPVVTLRALGDQRAALSRPTTLAKTKTKMCK